MPHLQTYKNAESSYSAVSVMCIGGKTNKTYEFRKMKSESSACTTQRELHVKVLTCWELGTSWNL